jgi:hypothetical protein
LCSWSKRNKEATTPQTKSADDHRIYENETKNKKKTFKNSHQRGIMKTDDKNPLFAQDEQT